MTSTWRRINNQVRTVLLLGALSALLIGVGGALAPGHLGIFLVLAIALNVGGYFFSDKLVLRMHGAREVTPETAPGLHRMVGELAVRANLPKPRVFVIDSPQPNAFATGRNPAHGVVAVTTGIVDVLSDRELRGVIAHELGHIQNRDILVSTLAAVAAGAVTWVAQAISFGALFGGSSSEDEGEGSAAGGLLLALVAPLAATLIQLGISRAREYGADDAGARISGDPLALASALEKLEAGARALPGADPQPATASLFIVNPFAGAGGIGRLFSTHPATEERVRRLRAMAGERVAA